MYDAYLQKEKKEIKTYKSNIILSHWNYVSINEAYFNKLRYIKKTLE